jgi:hypothetical protein
VAENQKSGKSAGYWSDRSATCQADIQTSHDRTQAYVTRYERLLLPWKTPSEEVFVTMWSKRLGDEAADMFSPSETSSSVVRKLARSS